MKLWYKKPAERWTEALPLGNGHMGAMVYGGAAMETVDLTENTCYSGEASDANNREGASGLLTGMRAALFAHDYECAEALADRVAGEKRNYGTNLPFGRLTVRLPHGDEAPEDYTRALNLPTATATVQYASGGARYAREVFLSHPHQLLVMALSCGTPGRLSFTASLDCRAEDCRTEDGDVVLMGYACETRHSDGKTGVALHARMRARADGGSVSCADGTLTVSNADSAVIFVAIGTDFEGASPRDALKDRIGAADRMPLDQLRKAHVEDFQALFNRVDIDLGSEDPDMPTDERLAAVKAGGADHVLTALMFQFGRYLLISSSREDSALPAHLQGIWNDDIACCMGWTCDMHLDINTQMNYWPAEVTNLPECALPLFRWIEERLMPSGRRTANATYGLPGWVAHTVSNAWGYSAPGWAAGWGLNPTAGLWIASHMWEHFLFSRDMDFLRGRVFHVYREAAEFFLAYLAEDPQSGYLLSGPSISPENVFGERAHYLSMGPVCDTVLIRELLRAFTAASELLEIRDPLRGAAEDALKRLPPFKVGRNGQLMEWLLDHHEPDAHHRHTSHLLALFPFAQITSDETPELAEAAKVSIARRTTPDEAWEDTGFARAQLMLYSARLREPESALRHILSFQRTLTNENLMSLIPPCAGAVTNVFELDGSSGFTAGVAEMLLQSHGGVIRALPALPGEWRNGRVSGLRARGGYTVDMAWKDGALIRLAITSPGGQSPIVTYGNGVLSMTPSEGGLTWHYRSE